ncbi:undecaprenyldiphospho-muramoylpentapeptide beta-N-acetylglucosaminyltransferase [Myxococcota bacterium]
MSRPCIVLAGGGTGGHVFPLLAVADALRAGASRLRLVFVGTARGIETDVVPERGYELELGRVQPIRGGGWMQAARGAVRAVTSVPEGWALLERLRPRAVLSIGGYAAGPVTLAARLRRVPLALMEPNARIGLANRLVAPLVQRAYTAFADVEPCFPRNAVLRTGVPIRSGFAPQLYQGHAGALRVLVLGGSQGAESLNREIPLALRRMATPTEVVHQAGRDRHFAVEGRYRELGMAPQVRVVPFIDDMPQAMAAADLVLGRSGASMVAEVCAVGRASVLIPYPHAAADHQLHNALSLERAGASVCLRATQANAERIAAEIDRLASIPGRFAAMAERARSLGQPEAAATIAADLLALGQLSEDGDPAQGKRDESVPPEATMCQMAGGLERRPPARAGLPGVPGEAIESVVMQLGAAGRLEVG